MLICILYARDKGFFIHLGKFLNYGDIDAITSETKYGFMSKAKRPAFIEVYTGKKSFNVLNQSKLIPEEKINLDTGDELQIRVVEFEGVYYTFHSAKCTRWNTSNSEEEVIHVWLLDTKHVDTPLGGIRYIPFQNRQGITKDLNDSLKSLVQLVRDIKSTKD